MSVEERTLNYELLESIRDALPADDPYHSVVDDHCAILHAKLDSQTFVAMNSEPMGYAVVRPSSQAQRTASLDIIVVPADDEIDITSSLLEAALQSTSEALAWWSRTANITHIDTLATKYGGKLDRIVERMERPLDIPYGETIETRSYSNAELENIVRINNEAFINHPDRSNMDQRSILDTLSLLGNQYDDFRVHDSAFAWMKRASIQETELFVLAVDDAHRSQGLGQKLLNTAFEHARHEHQADFMSLYVEQANSRAIALYMRNGFVNVYESLHSVLFPARLP